MAKIKITDLPKDTQISREEMKKVFGGAPRTVTMNIWQPVRGGISTPAAIDRNLLPGGLVTCEECCGCSCICNCEDCPPAGSSIRARY